MCVPTKRRNRTACRAQQVLHWRAYIEMRLDISLVTRSNLSSGIRFARPHFVVPRKLSIAEYRETFGSQAPRGACNLPTTTPLCSRAEHRNTQSIARQMMPVSPRTVADTTPHTVIAHWLGSASDAMRCEGLRLSVGLLAGGYSGKAQLELETGSRFEAHLPCEADPYRHERTCRSSPNARWPAAGSSELPRVCNAPAPWCSAGIAGGRVGADSCRRTGSGGTRACERRSLGRPQRRAPAPLDGH